MSPLTRLFASVRDRLVQSRFLTISATVHLIIIALLGTTIYYKLEPPLEKGEITSTQLVDVQDLPEHPPTVSTVPNVPKVDLTKGSTGASSLSENTVITSTGVTDFHVPPVGGSITMTQQPPSITQPGPIAPIPGDITPGEMKQLRDIAISRKRGVSSYEFTAYLGRYQKGNWDSTVRLTNGEITAGSLPNLLYCTSKWSKDKLKTNERNVKAIALDSDELLAVKPPFIFLTGTKDFTLNEKEVENLRAYIRLGGAIWGDSSVPGRRSAFDVAFCREMKHVLGDAAGKFEPLPANHPIFAQGYFKKISTQPSGINNYSDPIEVLKWGGEVAIIHTINDYGDMWQIGLDKNGQIDLSRNARGEYVAMNAALWDQRGLYVRNLEQPSVEEAYKFGINMIFHLLTRWENRTASIGTL
ncbi:hypothetical protein BH09VER1_BH09VER1_05500 [soil metagenome]